MVPLNFYIFAYWHDSRWEKFVGATVKIWDLSQNISKLGHNATLFLPRKNFDLDESVVKIVEIPYLNLPFLRFLSFNIFLVIYLFMYSFRERPDVVYVRRMASIIPCIYARLVSSVFFYEVNDDPYRKDFHEGSLVAFRVRTFISEWQDKINLKLCHRASVVTHQIIEKILKKNPDLRAKKLIELPSGANCDLFSPMPIKKCRLRLDLDLDKKYIGFVGTLLKHQGIETLIDAAPTIIKDVPECVLFIIGEGPMKDRWMNEVGRQDLGKYFIFTGQVDYKDMPMWINAMDVCVAPFLNSAGLRSPVKIFDYMSCGKPVVASSIEGTTDVFEHSKAIGLIEPGNAEVLSKSIIGLLCNQEKADTMGKNGRAFILEKYDRKAMAKRICDEAILLLQPDI